ncbi:Ldh family oxidoreductase [Halosolutus halophilus]|uniref:Ldh family oxidoreductase n=1 Tax=Halosolutus halophilus TaxID=1552990 RepID=UPI002234F990|nr:Ldh family oxidoreductase [Halosolutus halophilus]
MEVDRSRAKRVASEAFQAHGIAPADSDLAADVLVTADAMGKGSHGLLRLPRYVRGIEHGNVDPEGKIEVVRDSGAAATLDGGSKLGATVATRAIAEAMDRADEYGVGVVGAHSSNHLGMLGYYTNQARHDGYVAIGMTNTEPAMPPYGGSEPILGTNPIAIGLPTHPPFNLDMSTSSIARGKILEKSEQGGSISEEIALDSQGEPTTDPEAALEGTILPFGGPKGSGLAIAVEILAGGLVGAAMGREVTGTYHTEDPCTKGDLFAIIDPDALAGKGFADRASEYLHSLKREPLASGFDEIRLPGERSVKRERNAETISIDDDLWEEVQSLTE